MGRESEAIALVSSNHSNGSPGVPPAPHFSRAVEILLVFALSLVLLVPCVWQERIQAGDLSSHLYNAWLVEQIKSGAVTGLTIVPLSTNVLTDWILERLVYSAGSLAAERIVSAAAVLIFFWGSFFALNTATGRRPWLFSPLLAMLAYGLVFHSGFLNFYLSTGLCLWILGLCWNVSRKRALAAVPVAVLAWTADALPVFWVCAILGYFHAVRRIPAPWRLAAPLGGAAALVALQSFLMNRSPFHWSLEQVFGLNGIARITGVEQFWLYDPKYLVLSGAVLIVLLVLLLERLDQGNLLADPVVQIWSLHVLAIALMPVAIQLTQYGRVLAYNPQQLSLLTVLFFLLTVGRARYGRGITRLTGFVATLFFTCLYLDGTAFNHVENQVADLVEKLPPAQRVVAGMSDSGARLNALMHVADRACIGRCFSYGNPEPASGQFRIRVTGPSRAVASSMKVIQEIEEGQHTVTSAEGPLYSICPFEQDSGHFYLRLIHVGEQTCAFSRQVSVRIFDTGLADVFAGTGAN